MSSTVCDTKFLRNTTSGLSHGINPSNVLKRHTGIKPVTELARLREIELETKRARVKAAREQAQVSKTAAKQVREERVREKVSMVKAMKASYKVRTPKMPKVTQPQRTVGTCAKKKSAVMKVVPQVYTNANAMAEFEAIISQEDVMIDALEVRVKSLFLRMGLDEEDLDEVSMDEEETDDEDLEKEIEDRLNAMSLFKMDEVSMDDEDLEEEIKTRLNALSSFKMDEESVDKIDLPEIDLTPCRPEEILVPQAFPSGNASPVAIPASIILQAAILITNPITTITTTQVSTLLETTAPPKFVISLVMPIPMGKVTQFTHPPYILALPKRFLPRVKLKSPRLSWKRVRLKI